MDCRTCGTWNCTLLASRILPGYDRDDRYRLSGLTRDANARGEVLELGDARALLDANPDPSPLAQADLVLAYLAKQNKPGGPPVPLDSERDYPIARTLGPDGLRFILRGLMEDGLIERTDKSDLPKYRVLMKGFRRAEEIKNAAPPAKPANSPPPQAVMSDPPTETRQAATPAPGQELASGSKFHTYQIEAKLGEGGMGVVYRAHDTRLGDVVALKTLSSKAAADPQRRRRFLDEIRLARKVTHQHVCRIHDFGDGNDDGILYFTMELIDGRTLKQELQAKGPIPAEAVIEIGISIAEGLQALHERNVVHRDIKSSNVMRDDR
ncbi:MAG: serine/threonine protein kinase, partial [Planctomycetes bacterium]|nr:serine/threonine protein kinase [Planctomycetota bacterium]